MKNEASQILQFVLDNITKKYDPEGNKIFSFAFMCGGQISGKILSPEFAVLTGRSGEHKNNHILYIMDPQRLVDYQAPFLALEIIPHGKVGNMVEFYYPEGDIHSELKDIIALIKKTLENSEQGWVHLTNWI